MASAGERLMFARWWKTFLAAIRPRPTPAEKPALNEYGMYWHPGAGWTRNHPTESA
jgi:hypothetical protein